MTIEQILNVFQSRPFRPIVVHLVDGRRFTIRHPEFVTFASDGTTIALHHEEEGVTVVDPSMVQELEIKSNVVGTGKRPKG
jgi:hypothetical protein